MREQDVRLLMDTSPEGRIDVGWQAGVIRQRAKTVRAGRHLYLDAYPIWDTVMSRQAEDNARKVKAKDPEKRRKINARQAQRRLVVLINANFGEGDILITCTYPDDRQPGSADKAHRDARNMIARVRRLYGKLGIVLKYVYVTETTTSAKRGTRYHHHLIVTGGVSRETIEALWYDRHGGICNSRRAQRTREGLTGWAKYITKQVGGSDQTVATKRKWCASKNLIKPRPTTADKKISRRRVERIAAEMDADRPETRAILERIYPDYELVECEVRVSDWVTGAYISAVMVRREECTCQH